MLLSSQYSLVHFLLWHLLQILGIFDLSIIKMAILWHVQCLCLINFMTNSKFLMTCSFLSCERNCCFEISGCCCFVVLFFSLFLFLLFLCCIFSWFVLPRYFLFCFFPCFCSCNAVLTLFLLEWKATFWLRFLNKL